MVCKPGSVLTRGFSTVGVASISIRLEHVHTGTIYKTDLFAVAPFDHTLPLTVRLINPICKYIIYTYHIALSAHLYYCL